LRMEVAVGKAAPEFELPASSGATASLKHYRKQWVVLYFYPNDDTPGCTIEACEFGKLNSGFSKKGAVVLGISPNDLRSHEKFIKKFGLPFVLLADLEHKVAETYGVWGEKMNFGRKYWGVLRSTFLIDPQGKIKKIWPKVRAEGHAAEVLKEIP
jgi:peroxiredoxin Q/BCP